MVAAPKPSCGLGPVWAGVAPNAEPNEAVGAAPNGALVAALGALAAAEAQAPKAGLGLGPAWL